MGAVPSEGVVARQDSDGVGHGAVDRAGGVREAR